MLSLLMIPPAAPKRYLLRYVLMLNNAEKRIPELVRYCQEYNIESVMIVTESHSLHLRHRTVGEARRYAQMLTECGKALRLANVEFGFNIWQTLGHHDAAQSSVKHFDWRPMVGHDGTISGRSPCPRDSIWIEHIAALFQEYSVSRPDYIFLDDDFRWHNHLPVQWGCYCEAHLDRYAEKVGRKVTREQLIEEVYGGGFPVSEARQIWHGILREDLETVAARLEQAIHEVTPETVIGLMSSCPETHSAEGRDWKRIIETLAGEKRPLLCRPTLGVGCYREFNAFQLFEGIHTALATKALLPEETRITPELEASPFTRFNKSSAHIRMQLALSYFCVSPECTLDIHSFTSPALDEERGYTELLRQSRKFFDYLAAAGPGRLRGLSVPIVENAADYSRSTELSPKGAVVRRTWEGCLPQLGIPICTDDVIFADGRKRGVANPLPRVISGDLPLSVPEEVLLQWLEGGLILDARAAEAFALRGLSHLVGATTGKGLGDRLLGCEEITDERFGIVGTRMAVRHMNGKIHALMPAEGAQVISRLLLGDEVGEAVDFGAGCVIFQNRLGGRVGVFPYDGQTETLEAVQFRSYHRQRQMQDLIRWIARDAPFIALDRSANVAPFWRQTETEVLLGLCNASLDAMPLHLIWRNLSSIDHATLVLFDEREGIACRRIAFQVRGEIVEFDELLPPWQFSVLKICLRSIPLHQDSPR